MNGYKSDKDLNINFHSNYANNSLSKAKIFNIYI